MACEVLAGRDPGARGGTAAELIVRRDPRSPTLQEAFGLRGVIARATRSGDLPNQGSGVLSALLYAIVRPGSMVIVSTPQGSRHAVRNFRELRADCPRPIHRSPIESRGSPSEIAGRVSVSGPGDAHPADYSVMRAAGIVARPSPPDGAATSAPGRVERDRGHAHRLCSLVPRLAPRTATRVDRSTVTSRRPRNHSLGAVLRTSTCRRLNRWNPRPTPRWLLSPSIAVVSAASRLAAGRA